MSSDAFPRQQGEETEEWVSQEVKIEAKKDRFGEPQPSVTRLSFLSSVPSLGRLRLRGIDSENLSL